MFTLELKSKKSIYEQIIDGYKKMIISGELKPDDKILSVRELSEQLTVNPNTVQKAYKALEQQGWIYVVSGRGNFVSDESHGADNAQVKEICDSIGSLIEELSYLGLSNAEIADYFQGLLKERGRNND